MTPTFIAMTIFFTLAFAVQFIAYRRLKNDLQVAIQKLEHARMDFSNLKYKSGRIDKDIQGLFMSRCNHAGRLEVLENDILRYNTDVIHGTLTVITRTPR